MDVEKERLEENVMADRLVRPKCFQIVEFSVNGEKKRGKVTKVGKQSVTDKHRCWIQCTMGNQ